MTIDTITRIIQQILTPSVLATTCAIILGGMLSHYSAISDRLRILASEQRGLLRVTNQAASTLDLERRQEIDRQAVELLQRHKMVRDAILAVYGAIAIFIGSMFIIAASVVAGSIWLATLALACFLIGTGALFFGIVWTFLELRISHRAVQYEMQRALELGNNEHSTIE
jgi:hypothetical protein